MAKRKRAKGSAAARTTTAGTRGRKAARKATASRAAKATGRAAKKTARKAAARKASPKRAAAKRAPAKKAAARKAAVRRATVKKAAVKKAAVKAAAKKTTRKVARPTSGRGSRAEAPVRKAAAPPRKAAKAPAAGPSRSRRVKAEAVRAPIPSSLDLPAGASAARSGREELLEHIQEHTETGPALTAGDLDANWEVAYSSGDEAPGGDNPTPDQDVVDDIGHALGIEYGPTEELRGATKVEDRDKHRWELDPASSEDYTDRRRDE